MKRAWWNKVLILTIIWTSLAGYGAELIFPEHVHFRGDVKLEATASASGMELAAKQAGFTLDSFSRTVTKPTSNHLKVRLEMRAMKEKLPLLLCVSSGPGCASPAIKQKIELPADGQLTVRNFEYDLTAFSTPIILELIVEGNVPSGSLLEISNLTLAEAPAPFFCRIEPNSKNLASEQKSVRLHWKNHLPEQQIIGNISFDTLPKRAFTLPTLPEGFLDLEIPEEAHQAEVAVAGKRFIFSRPPSTPGALEIRDRVPYWNDEPYFAIGIFHTSDRVRELLNEDNRQLNLPELTRKELFASLAAKKFNTLHHGWGCAPPDFYREAAEFGLKVMSESRSDLAGAEIAAQEPNAAGFYIWDEPKQSDYEACSELFQAYRTSVPSQPTLMAFDLRPTGVPAEGFVDIAMFDPYPITEETSRVDAIVEYVEAARKYLNFSDPSTCEYAVLQAFTIDGSRFSCEPSFEQVRAEAACALIAGVKGIYYYASQFQKDWLFPVNNSFSRAPSPS